MRVHELHASVSPISRGEGKSSVQQGAYILRARMVDEHTGEVWDYRQRGGLLYSGMAVQDDGHAPDWAYEPDKLVNAIEKTEKRKDSLVGRMMTVAHPFQFDERMRREADLKIAHEIVRRYGGAVIYAAHAPHEEGDERNYHAHYQWTPRRFENGQFAAKGRMTETPNASRKKLFVPYCALDDVRRGRGRKEMENLRETIAGIHNDIAVRENLPCYTEHLSYEKRGIDKEATQHMGAWATRLERKGKTSAIGDKNREIATRNQERARNVIDIEEAKAKLRRRQAAAKPRGTDEERYQAFYRTTYERRAAMLEAFERQYGQQEKKLMAEAAQLAGSIEKAGFVMRAWRKVTGRMQAEKDALQNVKARLAEIDRQRKAARSAFEEDRMQRLEALKAAQQRELQEEADPLPRAVGETPRLQAPRRNGNGNPGEAGSGSSPAARGGKGQRSQAQRIFQEARGGEETPARGGTAQGPLARAGPPVQGCDRRAAENARGCAGSQRADRNAWRSPCPG